MQSKEILENCLSFRAKPISFGLSDGQKKKKKQQEFKCSRQRIEMGNGPGMLEREKICQI